MKTYKLEKTDSKDLFRVVDRNGDWKTYYHKPSKRYLRSVNNILDEGYPKGQGFYKYLLSVSADEAKKRLEAAGERGDKIHQAIRILLNVGKINRSVKVLAEDNQTETTLTNDEWNCLLAFGEFWNRHEAELLSCEKSVANLEIGYAGTLDAIAILHKNCGVKSCKCDEFVGKVGLLDWKSSGGIYDNYSAQVAAYSKADGIKADYTGIVRVGSNHKTTGGYEFKPFSLEETNDNFNKFLAAKALADKNYKEFTAGEIEEIPDVIVIGKSVKPKRAKKIRVKTKKNGKANNSK